MNDKGTAKACLNVSFTECQINISACSLPVAAI